MVVHSGVRKNAGLVLGPRGSLTKVPPKLHWLAKHASATGHRTLFFDPHDGVIAATRDSVCCQTFTGASVRQDHVIDLTNGQGQHVSLLASSLSSSDLWIPWLRPCVCVQQLQDAGSPFYSDPKCSCGEEALETPLPSSINFCGFSSLRPYSCLLPQQQI